VKIVTDYNDDRRRSALAKKGGTEISPVSDFGWVDPSWGARRRARGIGRTLEEYVGGLEVAKRFVDAATEYQRSVGEFELARDRRSLVPAFIEKERQELGLELQKGQQAASLAAGDYEIDALLREEQKIQILQRIRRLREGGLSSGPMDDTPPDLRASLATEHAVARNREWIRGKIEEIRRRAADEKRPLSAEEIEKIDRYQDAEVSTEASLRRRGASDL
jgi:hypothetical protein